MKSGKYIALFFALLMAVSGFSSCKKKVIENKVYDNIIYELDTTPVYSSNLEKTKQKSGDQYVSILYADLFNQTISSAELTDLAEVMLAIGDKQMASQLVLSAYMASPGVDVPTNQTMRNDIETFISNTYIRFYLRKPTEYERYYLKQLIEEDPNLTPDLIYTSFALSDEYYFY